MIDGMQRMALRAEAQTIVDRYTKITKSWLKENGGRHPSQKRIEYVLRNLLAAQKLVEELSE